MKIVLNGVKNNNKREAFCFHLNYLNASSKCYSANRDENNRGKHRDIKVDSMKKQQ